METTHRSLPQQSTGLDHLQVLQVHRFLVIDEQQIYRGGSRGGGGGWRIRRGWGVEDKKGVGGGVNGVI